MEYNARGPGEEGELVESVLLGRMPQQAEVRFVEDDWTGSTNAAERRKRQNRLHQRIYRRRQKLLSMQSAPASLVMEETEPLESEIDPHLSTLLEFIKRRKQAENPANAVSPRQFTEYDYKQILLSSDLTPPQVQYIIRQVEDCIFRQRMTSSPRADLLLTLVQFNVFRALFSNMISLRFNLDWLTTDAISPFFQNTSRVWDTNCPASLCPTTLQRQVSHHPYLDLFPFPQLRDNMLSEGEDFDDDDLCHDLVEVCHAPSERSGLIVWGSPWDPSSWEVTTEFVEKWPWMLRGCRELLHSTNFWRRKRGEEELYFDTTVPERIHS
ncbi:uncharacterized protein EAF01_001543 [Botrytis porri]|uniref:BZIP domain-containing protein n=1 Tax=Botrytis porri TaxID=87229 RepID=A0A4Z1KWK2_9HELO|nr:uncharacterized protein EAF01_001543 [Botrytis porri]KAF7912522.1 hypothetical protein EAF01_001543 [Botrytis porri]TGO88912.1 hypothetical protein BPOR_0135g00180 [Botrytis porri]